MKIPLSVRQRFSQLMPFAFIGLRSSKYRIRPMPIWVLVDTGSPWTAITPDDAMKLDIPTHALKPDTKYPIILFAGGKFRRLLLTDTSLNIREETGKTVTFVPPPITVLSPTKKISPEEFRGIPSVLGDDFLTTEGLSLHFDPRKEEAFLFRP
jgi:hypothetical protein